MRSPSVERIMNLPSSGYYCHGCGEKIYDKYFLIAVEQSWHENCLRCFCCRSRLCDPGQRLFYRDGMTLCGQDYIRLYAQEGNCASCKKVIHFRDIVMRARDKVYHLDCFKCGVCNLRFCVGDKFCVHNEQLLCEYDYQEKRMFHMAAFNNDRLEEISKHIQELDEFDV